MEFFTKTCAGDLYLSILYRIKTNFCQLRKTAKFGSKNVSTGFLLPPDSQKTAEIRQSFARAKKSYDKKTEVLKMSLNSIFLNNRASL